jgi:hypothetical protein
MRMTFIIYKLMKSYSDGVAARLKFEQKKTDNISFDQPPPFVVPATVTSTVEQSS